MGTILDKLLDLEKTPTARPYGSEGYGLDRFAAFLESLGSPHRGLHFIHIAGTKGKGSTAAFCESILRAHGIPTALYSSPHLTHFGERFRLDGKALGADEFEARLEAFYTSLNPGQRAGFDGPHAYRTVFEVLTAFALVIFRERQEELRRQNPSLPPLVVCWETGLGGRLDCTNVVDPIGSVITAIGLDHTHILGKDIASITREKGGIIKPGRPVVVGRQEPASVDLVLDVLREIAIGKGAPLVRAWDHNPVHPGDGKVVYMLPDGSQSEGTPGLTGDFQLGNMEAAIAACWYAAKSIGRRLDAERVAKGLEGANWPGRLEIHRGVGGRLFLLDGAHCPLSARALGASCGAILGREGMERYTLLLGMQADKDHGEFVRSLVGSVGRMGIEKIVVYTVPGSRGATAADLARALVPLGIPVEEAPSPADALLGAFREPGAVISTGTLYTIESLRSLFLEKFGAVKSCDGSGTPPSP